jgi:hypothetical protein
MLLSAVSFSVVAQSSSEVPEGLMNNPVLISFFKSVGFGLQTNILISSANKIVKDLLFIIVGR